jgi:hypothetical protein
MKRYENWIGGKFVPANSGHKFSTHNPAKTSEAVAEYPQSAQPEATAAIDAAQQSIALSTYIFDRDEYGQQQTRRDSTKHECPPGTHYSKPNDCSVASQLARLSGSPLSRVALERHPRRALSPKARAVRQVDHLLLANKRATNEKRTGARALGP